MPFGPRFAQTRKAKRGNAGTFPPDRQNSAGYCGDLTVCQRGRLRRNCAVRPSAAVNIKALAGKGTGDGNVPETGGPANGVPPDAGVAKAGGVADPPAGGKGDAGPDADGAGRCAGSPALAPTRVTIAAPGVGRDAGPKPCCPTRTGEPATGAGVKPLTGPTTSPVRT